MICDHHRISVKWINNTPVSVKKVKKSVKKVSGLAMTNRTFQRLVVVREAHAVRKFLNLVVVREAHARKFQNLVVAREVQPNLFSTLILTTTRAITDIVQCTILDQSTIKKGCPNSKKLLTALKKAISILEKKTCLFTTGLHGINSVVVVVVVDVVTIFFRKLVGVFSNVLEQNELTIS